MVKIFADGADYDSIIELNRNPLIKGFTTNPALLRKAGVKNYREFALRLLDKVKDKPVSFEVLSDDFDEMFLQAMEISSWGDNVYVKIPITNTHGTSSYHLIEELNDKFVQLNVTAVTTLKQVSHIAPALIGAVNPYISIFAGRIADTGIDPVSVISHALEMLEGTGIKVIWASPREVLNIYQANDISCHVITCTPDLIKKYQSLRGKDLTEYSRDTVKMFYKDGQEAGYKL